jgi:hypothetical protein
VSEVALLVNESVRKKQNLEQLAELEKRLTGKYPVRALSPQENRSLRAPRTTHKHRMEL